MLTIQKKFDKTSLRNQITDLLSSISSIDDNVRAKKKDDVSRLTAVLQDFRQRIEKAHPLNTSASVFSSADSHLNTANDLLKRMSESSNKDVYAELVDDLTKLADRFLDIFPFMDVTQSNNEILSESKQILDDLKETGTQSKELLNQTEKTYQETLNLKVKNETLSQLLAGKVLNNDYQKRADSEKKIALIWTTITAVAAGVTLIVLVIAFVWQYQAIKDNEINYQLISTKFLITLTLGLFARWASKRASRHLQEESKYHRLAVNIATINSFIAPLDDEHKNAVLSEVAIKTFTDGTGNDTSTEYEGLSASDIIRNLLPKIGK